MNKYKTTEKTEVEVLDIDNDAVRLSQIERLNHIKATRDSAAVTAALTALTEAAPLGE